MTDVKELMRHIDFLIENQEGLKEENAPLTFPEWNRGYLEALQDLKKFISS